MLKAAHPSDSTGTALKSGAAAAHGTMFKAAMRLGVPIALGTVAGVYPHGINAMEFALMTDWG